MAADRVSTGASAAEGAAMTFTADGKAGAQAMLDIFSRLAGSARGPATPPIPPPATAGFGVRRTPNESALQAGSRKSPMARYFW